MVLDAQIAPVKNSYTEMNILKLNKYFFYYAFRNSPRQKSREVLIRNSIDIIVKPPQQILLDVSAPTRLYEG